MNDKQPLVSAIITTRNRLELLRRAIDGVRGQTYANIELIVVDDGSDDGTKEYCESESFKYIRIEKEDRRGGNFARNLGIESSNGEYIAFCDDDDYWLPSKIEKQLAKMTDKVGLVFCQRRVEFVRGEGSIEYSDQRIPTELRGDMSRRSLYSISAITSAILVKRTILNESGNFDVRLKFWQEYELSIRIAQLTDFDFIEEPLYLYRVNFNDPNRLTNKYWNWREAVRYVHNKHKRLYADLSLREKLLVKKMVATDGIERAYASGLKYQWYKNRILRLFYSLITS